MSSNLPVAIEGETLTQNGKAFIEEYTTHFDLELAVRRSGLADDDLTVYDLRIMGLQLLADPIIHGVIEGTKIHKANRSRATAESVEQRLNDIAFAQLTDVLITTPTGRVKLKPIEDWPERARAAVKRISYDMSGQPVVEMHDPMKSFDLLGKILEMFQEKEKFKQRIELVINADFAKSGKKVIEGESSAPRGPANFGSPAAIPENTRHGDVE